MKFTNTLFTSILCGSLLCLAQPSIAYSQIFDGDNINEDEWIDPTDWFDGNDYEWDDTLGLDYSYDDYGYDYDYGLDDLDDYDYDYGLYDDDYDYGFDDYGYDYDYGLDDDEYGYDYDYGWDTDFDYDFTGTDDLNYGWHYQWDPQQRAWTRQYGYYDDYYDYDDTWQRQNRSSQRQQVSQQQQMSQPQQNRRQQQISQQQQQQVSQRTSRMGGQRVVRGEVDTVRTLNLTDRTGQRQRHKVAQVLLEDGRLVLVDFGRDRQGLRGTLKEGDRLVVRGQTGTIRGRRVLMANQAQINGRSYQINRSSQQNQQAGRGQTQPSSYISGRLLSVRPVNLGDNMNRNCIRLQMQNGQTALVDLGTRISLSELDIAPNDLITIQGRRTTLNGRQVFRASRIWINGDETQLNRSQSAGRSQISLQK